MFKRFKEKQKFIQVFKQFKISRYTNMLKLTEKYLRLMKSSVTPNLMKTAFKDTKEIYSEKST